MPPEVAWRPPRREDDPEWADLLAAMEVVDGHGETYELADLSDEWASVWAHPDTDATCLWEGTRLIGFGWCKTVPGAGDQPNRVECWGGIRPTHRRRGLGRRMLAWQVARATAIAATLESAAPTEVRLEVRDHEADLRGLAEGLGFASVRRFSEVARSTAVALPPAPPPDGVELVPWHAALDEPTRRAHDVAFAQHWGSEPRTVEEWRQWYTGHRAFRPELSRLAVDRAAGAVLGFALVATYPQDWHLAPREAWVTTVGTHPDHRRRGLGRATVVGALAAVAGAADGFERAILGVDEANPTGARELYAALGFAPVRAVTTFALER